MLCTGRFILVESVHLSCSKNDLAENSDFPPILGQIIWAQNWLKWHMAMKIYLTVFLIEKLDFPGEMTPEKMQ